MTTPFEYMTQGKLFSAFIQAFIDAGISESMLFSIFLMTAGIIMYIRTREIGVIGLAMMFSAISIINYINPAVAKYLSWLVYFAVVVVIYRFFKGSR